MKISSQMDQTLSLVLAGGGGGGGRQSGGGVVSSTMSSSVTGSRGLVLVTDKVVSPFALLEVCNGLACGKKQKKVINSAFGTLLMLHYYSYFRNLFGKWKLQ